MQMNFLCKLGKHEWRFSAWHSNLIGVDTIHIFTIHEFCSKCWQSEFYYYVWEIINRKIYEASLTEKELEDSRGFYALREEWIKKSIELETMEDGVGCSGKH